jgi:hypothetical protein
VNVDLYLGLLHSGERVLAQSFHLVAEHHGDEPDVHGICLTLAEQCDDHAHRLAPMLDRYGERPDGEPARFHADALTEGRTGPVGLLRDLQDLHLLASLVDVTGTVLRQAALALRDEELLALLEDHRAETAIQEAWLLTRIKQAAPQALLVAT